MIDTLGPPRPVPPGRKFPFNQILSLRQMEDRCVRCLRWITPKEPTGREYGGMLCGDCEFGRGDAA